MNYINVAKRLYILISVFLFGFLLLYLINIYFYNIEHLLDKKLNNYEARIQIGEFIAEDINKLEAEFFGFATIATSKKSREIFKKKIYKTIKDINYALEILEYGGIYKRKIYLNTANKDELIKEIIVAKNKDHSLEYITIKPLLIEIKKVLDELEQKLVQKRKYKRKNIKKMLRLDREISIILKSMPSYFSRMHERAKRLLYEGDIKLKKIKAEICKQKDFNRRLKNIIMLSIIVISLIISYYIIKQIDKRNKELIELNKNLFYQEKKVKAILNSQENIVIVSDGNTMLDVNEAIVDFFEYFNNINDFLDNHTCICDFFKKDVPDDSYIVKKDYNGKNWLEYILDSKKRFKVIMNNGKEDHHFAIVAKKTKVSNDNYIIVVSLSDITEEVLAQLKLKELNNNLEKLIDEKTKELQKLNKSLAQKVKEQVRKNREKDQQLIQQSRFAAMGEMIGNIAHQWRQPLSAISSTASSMQLQLQLGIIDNNEISKSYDDIKSYVDFLSQTIEDFRNFFKDNDNIEIFNLVSAIDKTLTLIKASYKDNDIKLIQKYLDKEMLIKGSVSKLSQVFLNILNNAKDIIVEKNLDSEQRYVHIRIEEDNYNYLVFIQDNAGGVPNDIIEKIFDPYFTTKHQSQGTGIGLYMSKIIIEKHMKGTISVSNEQIVLDDIEYNGACFKIILPKVNNA